MEVHDIRKALSLARHFHPQGAFTEFSAIKLRVFGKKLHKCSYDSAKFARIRRERARVDTGSDAGGVCLNRLVTANLLQ
jgi:hypothetical protein